VNYNLNYFWSINR